MGSKISISGGRIRVVAPSGVFDQKRFEDGLRLIEAAGFEPVFDEGLFARQGYLAGDDERRLRELSRALADRGATALWAARGGYGATRLLARLPMDEIARFGKPLVGFSDVTALHAAWSRMGVPSIHGANVTTLSDWSASARDELLQLLRQPGPQRFVGEPVLGADAGPVSGPLRGGNLTVLAAMCGTGFLPDLDGAVWFIEDVGEAPYRLDRCLTQLLQAGALRAVRGVAVGQLHQCGSSSSAACSEAEALEVVASVLAPLGVPVVGNLPVGHHASSRAIALEGRATLDARTGRLDIEPAGPMN